MSEDTTQFLADLQDDGMSTDASGIVVENLNALTLAGAQGTSIDELSGDEVTLYCIVFDQSSSMYPYTSIVEKAYETHINALKGSRAAEEILVSAWVFNTRIDLLHGYLALNDLPPFSLEPDSETALYDAVLYALVSAVKYGTTLRKNGIRTKVVIDIFTDGEDNSSHTGVEGKLRDLIAGLYEQEYYYLTLVAFGRGYAYDVARELGIREILEFDADESSIRRAMNERSKSVIRTSLTTIDQSSQGDFFN